MRKIFGKLEIGEDGINKKVHVTEKNVFCKYCLKPLSNGESVLLCEVDKSVRCIDRNCMKKACVPIGEKDEHIDFKGRLVINEA